MLDLTPFDFTPTESLVYQVLVTRGPGTGYAIARAAGLARANAYAALEGLVAKGAARGEGGKPRTYRPEPPPVLLGRIVDRQGRAIEELASALAQVAVPATPTLTEVTSLRGAANLLSLEIARARERVDLVAPGEALSLMGPALRRAGLAGVTLAIGSDAPASTEGAEVRVIEINGRWPGRPLLAAIDDRAGLLGSIAAGRVSGHWGSDPTLVAAARLAIGAL